MSKSLLAAIAMLHEANLSETENALNCGPRERFTTLLSVNHGEKPVSAGLQGTDKVLELFASNDGSTWSILVTDQAGQSCLVAVGTDWTLGGFMPAGIPG